MALRGGWCEVQLRAGDTTGSEMSGSRTKTRSRQKQLRDKRRLLAFLIRKRCQGESVRVDFWNICDKLKQLISMEDHLIDLNKHTEQRLVVLVATVQRSLNSVVEEDNFLCQLMESEVKCNRIFTEVLSSNPTRFGEDGEYTHRYTVAILLDPCVRMPNDYIYLENSKKILF